MNEMSRAGGMPADVKARLAAIGPAFNPEVLTATQAMYEPGLDIRPAPGVKVEPDIAYGTDPRQRLDLFRPAKAGAPVVIYIPGGGYVGGDKRMSAKFYANIGLYFANRGYVLITANYRLAPAHPYPAGSEDVGGAVRWAAANAARHGGDASRIFVIGQSAGASHVAGYLFDPDRFAVPAAVRAGVLLSGGYRAFTDNPSPGIRAYFGSDTSLYADRSPAGHAHRSRVPLAISLAEFDPIHLSTAALDLAREVTERDGRCPPLKWFGGHNHVSTVFSFGTEDDEVGGWIREFIAAHE